MIFRRSYKLQITPFVLLAAFFLVVVGIFTKTFWIPFLVVLFLVYWIIAIIADYLKQFTITEDKIVMRGFIGGPLVIKKNEVANCKYIRYRGTTRGGSDWNFIEITSTSYIRIQVWRWGWGKKHQELFRLLKNWLVDANVNLDDKVQLFFDKATR